MIVLKALISFGMAAAVLLPFSGLSSARAGDAAVPLIERYRQALDVDPENLTLHYYLGVALLLDDRPAEAVTEFRRAYPAFSDAIEMNYNLGIALTRIGDADSAQLYLEQAEALGALRQAEIFPLPSAYYNIGLLYLEGGQTEEALRIFEKVLALDPGRIDIRRLLGEIHARADRDEKAIEAFSAYLQAYPGDAEVREYLFAIFFNIGLKELEKDRLDTARSGFEQALDISPGSPVANYYLGFIAYREKDWAETVRKLSAPYADYPEDLRRAARSLLYNSVLSLQEAGRAERALEAVTPLARMHPEDPKVLYLAGNIHLALKEFAEAQQLYEQVLALEPGHRGATLNLVAARSGAVDEFIGKGQDLFRRESYPEAARLFRQALSINPADPTARAYLDEIETELDKALIRQIADAESAMKEGRLQEAMHAALLGLELQPESAAATKVLETIRASAREEIEQCLRKARGAFERGELMPAETGFARVLSLDPEHTEARRGLDEVRSARIGMAASLAADGKEFLDKGQLVEARGAFSASLALLPDLPEALDGQRQLEALVSSMFAEEVKWARRAVSEGRLEVAESHYRKALDLKDDAAVRTEASELAERKRQRLEGILAATRRARDEGDYRRAASMIRKALAAAPDNDVAKRLLKEVSTAAAAAVTKMLAAASDALSAGEPGLALARYRKVLDLEPANAAALAGLESGRQALAAEVDNLASRAAEALAADQLDSARALVKQALTLDPYSGNAREVSKRIKVAERRRQQGLKVADVNNLYLDGIQFYTQGLYPEAMAAWEKVLAVDPEHEKALRNIEKAHRKLEKIRERQNG